MARAADRLPRRGATGPWQATNSYPRDLLVLRLGRIGGRHLRFSPAPTPSADSRRLPGKTQEVA